MLNPKTNQRELVYAVRVTDITPIEGADKVELAHVNGWHVMVRKDTFHTGDLAIYFEIDSKVPATEPFEFLSKYKYHVKTQKFLQGQVLSQGLIMTPEELGLKDVKEGDFLTEKLGVTYYEPEDNVRKADNKKLAEMKVDKFMIKWTKKHKLLSKIKFIYNLHRKLWLKHYFKKQQKKKNDFPYWVVKTDEERVQNLPHLFNNNDKLYVATEKIDGTSTTFTMQQAPKKKRKEYICSRNIVFNSSEKNDRCFYKDTDGNVYVEMFEKYNISKVLNYILDKHPEYEFITIQGETYGGTIQKRSYGPEHRLAIFNYIYKVKGEAPIRLNPVQMKNVINSINEAIGTKLEIAPILDTEFKLPNTCEELLELAEGDSKIDGKPREGIVFRDNKGEESFKAVSNKFLEMFHQ